MSQSTNSADLEKERERQEETTKPARRDEAEERLQHAQWMESWVEQHPKS